LCFLKEKRPTIRRKLSRVRQTLLRGWIGNPRERLYPSIKPSLLA
ncbi:4831_t:CDS:1, partial [Funneliformis mosseae]